MQNEDLFYNYINKKYKQLEWYTPNLPTNTEYYAIITEPRQLKEIAVVSKIVLYYLNETNSNIKWGLQIFHGTENEDFVKYELKDIKNVIYVNTGVPNFNKISYNKYYKSFDFWSKVLGKKVLTFQTDSILLRHGIDEFLQYDYIGAPWSKHKENSYVGNGGLSLRSVDKMLELSKLDNENEPNWEDIFFVKHLKIDNLPSPITAGQFSVEDVYYPNPLGIHFSKKINTFLLQKLLVI